MRGLPIVLVAAAFLLAASVSVLTIPTTRAGPCGGAVLRKPGGGVWRCSFDDEFSGTALDTARWTPQLTSDSGYKTGPRATPACYFADNVSVSGGALHLTARRSPAPFTCASSTGDFVTRYTSGQVTTVGGFHQTYGRFEVRARVPATTVPGLQETLWLWPLNAVRYGPYPAAGEIDFAEFYSRYADLDVPFLHYRYGSSSYPSRTNVVTTFTCRIRRGAYNSYGLEWLPGRLTLLVNGRTCLVDNYVPVGLTRPAPFDQPFFIALTQALGVNTNAFDARRTPLPATTDVDYVRVWR